MLLDSYRYEEIRDPKLFGNAQSLDCLSFDIFPIIYIVFIILGFASGVPFSGAKLRNVGSMMSLRIHNGIMDP